ncbi:MAG: endo-alpha-N-acetylgalactosaminidase family protein [Planctomycetota bacterium]|nr:endo-alpha-N-acetylgalactosaminidase family protein [Planctomycetota bacterium]
MERFSVDLDRKVLSPVREKGARAKLTLTVVEADGSRRPLRCSDAVITAKTKAASGNVEVVVIQGDTVVAREGGIATLEATVVEGGKTLTAAADVVVAPFFRDYHQTLVLKLFLGMEGVPVERLAGEALFQKPHDVLCTFEEALEVIGKTDTLTRGIPKIVYLVGWQRGGHDHEYPSWSDVNPRLKRAQDATALESLRWLIREARQFNTTVSLHINMVDAYKHSPVWEEYLAKDCIARDESGRLLSPGIQIVGEEMYNVVYPREWEAGLGQRRIDGLIALIPELNEGHTIHIDVFIANREDGKAVSPWHARPENGGLTPDTYVETQRKIFHYWRDRGFDVTGEGIFWAHPPGEGFTGLQAMSWWYPGDPGYQMQIPECLMARGRTDRGSDGDFRFTSSMHGEEIYLRDKEALPGFLGMFCRTALPWYYLSRLERQRFEDDALYYSDGVVARVENGKRIIRKGDFVLREDDHLFVPALWNEKEIIAYSEWGYDQKPWPLPAEWRGVKSVDLYAITLSGCVPLRKSVPIDDGKLVMSLEKGEGVSIVPAGARLSGSAAAASIPTWAMGPFVKIDHPILEPTPDSTFPCGIVGQTIAWESMAVYNPAPVVRDGRIHILYRADARNPALQWGRTCRIGLASSEDGITFTRHPRPVLYPANDAWKQYEWEGGCEDLHVVEGEDGVYYMNYTAWDGHRDAMCVATSSDLIQWTKHGPAFGKRAPGSVWHTRSGVVITRLESGRLIAARINGKYLMYYTHECRMATSDNLIDWEPLPTVVWPTYRQGFFDSGSCESGAIALLREDGILLMYNGGDSLSGRWTLGQALLDARRPDRVLAVLHRPFLVRDRSWETPPAGFPHDCVVANGMVPFKGQWLLYYGACDHVIGLAVCDHGGRIGNRDQGQ